MTRTQRILAVCLTTVACVLGATAPALALGPNASTPVTEPNGDNWGTTAPATVE
ncbi:MULTISPECIES: hypothetical protein [unclassified Streptomyces]|uniref:Uncharacterized protein n=1 Tax=Streptomyces millisiae TaxID=3075542 RepID=A0ABU2LSP8_9ACTN|nr:hypothetical protein [Streptomyces sp. DSM 44918]MDT0320083.1 hypothetical protein [Streptomyces sp. DSM 44918]